MPTSPIKKEKENPNFNDKASIFIKRVVAIAKNLVPQTKKFTILLQLFPCLTVIEKKVMNLCECENSE